MLISCSPKQEDNQELVIEHVQENINNLVEMEPVLGAPSFYVYKVDFYLENKLIAQFEDGHILGYLLAEYSVENDILKYNEKRIHTNRTFTWNGCHVHSCLHRNSSNQSNASIRNS